MISRLFIRLNSALFIEDRTLVWSALPTELLTPPHHSPRATDDCEDAASLHRRRADPAR